MSKQIFKPTWEVKFANQDGEIVGTPLNAENTEGSVMDTFLAISKEKGKEVITLEAFGHVRLRARGGNMIGDFEYTSYVEEVEGDVEHAKQQVFNGMVLAEHDQVFTFREIELAKPEPEPEMAPEAPEEADSSEESESDDLPADES